MKDCPSWFYAYIVKSLLAQGDTLWNMQITNN